MKDLNRREFVAAAVATACCLCGMGGTAELLADTPTSAPSTTLDVGLKSSYSADGITDTWMKPPHKIAVIRHSGKIYACTTVCTHRGATINKVDDTSFVCPRHHAAYDINGNVTKGPAKLPLLRYAISVDANGHVIVDTSKVFTPDNWTDAGSFVSVS